MQTSIVILTYNSEKYIGPLVKSIYDHNTSDNFEVLIVDNKSSDKTVTVAKKLGSRVKVIETGENLGFAKGINYGAKHAKGKYLLFINPDAVWRDGTINDLLSVYERSERIGIVGGKLVNGVGIAEKSAGKFFGFWACVLIALGLDESFGIRFSPNRIRRVNFVSGGFLMIEKNVFEKLGGFDEHYFMYVEDMDLCFRAENERKLTYFTPNAVLEHASHGSSSRKFAIKNIYSGILYFQKMHKSALSYFIVYLLLYFKASALVIAGKIFNNRSLTETYSNII